MDRNSLTRKIIVGLIAALVLSASPGFAQTKVQYHEVNQGGHFAQSEQPQLFAEELRAAFKSLR